MMRGPAPPRFRTGTGTGTASGSVESGVGRETRSGNGDAPVLGTGGGAHGVVTRTSGVGPGSGARTRTETGSVEAVGAGNGHGGSGNERRSCVVVEVVAVATWPSHLSLVMHLLMMGLLGSLVLMALMAQRRRAGIVTGSDVGVTGASGNDAGTGIGTVIESTSGESGVVSEAGMRPEVGVGVARTTGWKVWAVTAATCTWSLRAAMGTWLQKMGISWRRRLNEEVFPAALFGRVPSQPSLSSSA